MKIEQEFGNTIYNDGTIAMKVKYIFDDVVSMMLFFKDDIWYNRQPNDGNNWEVYRDELTIVCTTYVKALDHYNKLIEGEEE
tara:strand:+ start:7452 stop:7697 length:246 start_codon:yes stop_codon:yes gene_type:complete